MGKGEVDLQNWGQEAFQFSQGWTVGRPQSGQMIAIFLLPLQSLLELTNKPQAPERVKGTPSTHIPTPTPTGNRVKEDFICIQPSCLSVPVNPINIFIKVYN